MQPGSESRKASTASEPQKSQEEARVRQPCHHVVLYYVLFYAIVQDAVLKQYVILLWMQLYSMLARSETWPSTALLNVFYELEPCHVK